MSSASRIAGAVISGRSVRTERTSSASFGSSWPSITPTPHPRLRYPFRLALSASSAKLTVHDPPSDLRGRRDRSSWLRSPQLPYGNGEVLCTPHAVSFHMSPHGSADSSTARVRVPGPTSHTFGSSRPTGTGVRAHPCRGHPFSSQSQSSDSHCVSPQVQGCFERQYSAAQLRPLRASRRISSTRSGGISTTFLPFAITSRRRTSP